MNLWHVKLRSRHLTFPYESASIDGYFASATMQINDFVSAIVEKRKLDPNNVIVTKIECLGTVDILGKDGKE